MSILLVGLNHRTAPVELREQLSLSGCGLAFALEELPVHDSIFKGDPAFGLQELPPVLHEGVILSTCNRMEIYASARDIGSGRIAMESYLSRLHGIPPSVLKSHLYFMHDRNAILHLMRVASGLDSMILGEPQILGQVNQAYQSAKTASASGPILSQLFTQSIHAGKRARTETEISQHSTSVSHASALLVEGEIGPLSSARVLVIGAGEMAQVAVQAFQGRGAENIAIINRTFSSAEKLTQEIGGHPIPWHQLDQALTEVDVVVSATGAPHTVLAVEDVEPVLENRDSRPLICIDIAVPRDIDPGVGDLPGVTRFDIDDLQSVVDENMAQREAAIPQVERIIEEETQRYSNWLSSRQVVPVITDLRTWATDMANDELQKALNRLEDLSEGEREIVEKLAHRIVNKLLHPPTASLREQAEHGNGYAHATIVRELFGLNETEPEQATESNSHYAGEPLTMSNGNGRYG